MYHRKQELFTTLMHICRTDIGSKETAWLTYIAAMMCVYSNCIGLLGNTLFLYCFIK